MYDYDENRVYCIVLSVGVQRSPQLTLFTSSLATATLSCETIIGLAALVIVFQPKIMKYVLKALIFVFTKTCYRYANYEVLYLQ